MSAHDWNVPDTVAVPTRSCRRLERMRVEVEAEAPIAVCDELIAIAQHVVGSDLFVCCGVVRDFVGFSHVGTRGWAWARSTPYGITPRGTWPPASTILA